MSPTPRVVVVGGGYGGVTAAKALDDALDVILVEPKDAFVHSVAALRGLVNAAFAPKVFYPYDRLLHRGRVIRDRATRVTPGRVELAGGATLDADYIVLASGSRYPFPAKMDVDDSHRALEKLARSRSALATAERVLLVGAGPVGLELAGEITDAWPSKQVTLVDIADDILAGHYQDELRMDLHRQLDERDVDLVLGSALTALPPLEPGTLGSFTVSTKSRMVLSADIWFKCFGVAPVSDYLGGTLAEARGGDGAVDVTEHLLIRGHETVFALGDMTAVPEQKRAAAAQRHAKVIADNLMSLATGGELATSYQPLSGSVVLPLGRHGGASQVSRPEGTKIFGADWTSEVKGRDLMTGRYAELFGLTQQQPDG